jgi:hypothetical protein
MSAVILLRRRKKIAHLTARRALLGAAALGATFLVAVLACTCVFLTGAAAVVVP